MGFLSDPLFLLLLIVVVQIELAFFSYLLSRVAKNGADLAALFLKHLQEHQ